MKEFFALPRQIQLREAMSFVARILQSAVLPFMAMYYVQYFGAFWTGILMMVTQMVGFVASLYGGHLADLWGRKKVIDWGLGLMALGYGLMVLANIPGHVLPLLTFVGILLAGTAGTFSWPAMDAMMIDLTDESNRRFVYTISYWFINVSVMLGAGLAGLFYDHHFFEMLVVLTLVCGVNFFIAWKYFHETKPADLVFKHGAGPLSTIKNYSQVFEDRIFLLYTLGILLNSVVWMQIDNYIPVQLKSNFETVQLFGTTITSAKMLSILVFTNTVLIVLLMTTMNRLTKRMKLLPQLLLGGVIFALGMYGALVLRSFLPLVLTSIFYTLGEMIYIPASQVLRAEMMDETKLGTYSGFVNMAHPLGSILAGGMVSLSSLTGSLGVELSYAFIAIAGLYLIYKSARLHGIQA